MNPLSSDRQPGRQTFAFSSFRLRIFISLWIFRKPFTTDKACNIVEAFFSVSFAYARALQQQLDCRFISCPEHVRVTTFFNTPAACCRQIESIRHPRAAPLSP